MANLELEDVLQKLRQLFAAEYTRGEQDAINRIVEAAHRGTSQRKPAKVVRPHEVDNGDGASRAPRGSVDELINRVLSERDQQGATATEIEQSANSPTEKTASLSGIRFALDRGRKQGRLLNREGRWFLNVTAEP
jgi:hypothetical protein